MTDDEERETLEALRWTAEHRRSVDQGRIAGYAADRDEERRHAETVGEPYPIDFHLIAPERSRQPRKRESRRWARDSRKLAGESMDAASIRWGRDEDERDTVVLAGYLAAVWDAEAFPPFLTVVLHCRCGATLTTLYVVNAEQPLNPGGREPWSADPDVLDQRPDGRFKVAVRCGRCGSNPQIGPPRLDQLFTYAREHAGAGVSDTVPVHVLGS